MMKVLCAFSALLAVALAKPSGFLAAAPLAYAAVPLAAPISSQYHAQDELGQYSYGYASGLSAKAETKTFDGVTRGSYSYVDAEGKLQSVEYVSDALNGFRAAASNLPVAPAVPALVAPAPVSDTPEVAEAKAQHLAALQEIASRSSAPTSSEAPSSEVTTEAPAPAEPSAAPSPAPEANASSEAPALSPVVPPAAAVVAAPYTFTVPVSTFAAPAVAAYSYGPTVLAYSAPWAVAAPAPAATIEAKAAPAPQAEEAKQN